MKTIGEEFDVPAFEDYLTKLAMTKPPTERNAARHAAISLLSEEQLSLLQETRKRKLSVLLAEIGTTIR